MRGRVLVHLARVRPTPLLLYLIGPPLLDDTPA